MPPTAPRPPHAGGEGSGEWGRSEGFRARVTDSGLGREFTMAHSSEAQRWDAGAAAVTAAARSAEGGGGVLTEVMVVAGGARRGAGYVTARPVFPQSSRALCNLHPPNSACISGRITPSCTAVEKIGVPPLRGCRPARPIIEKYASCAVKHALALQ